MDSYLINILVIRVFNLTKSVDEGYGSSQKIFIINTNIIVVDSYLKQLAKLYIVLLPFGY
jgi:hypothetical protein